ncbi:MAG: DUF72 domain-containing protein [Myxococcales bacterium]|nr:DUF72 domain-containing protein [Myxococcales bacterium]
MDVQPRSCDIPEPMLYAGATVERFPGKKYFASLRFVEFAPRAPLPRASTLTRFAHEMPDEAVIALRAPRAALVSELGPLRPSEAQAQALAWTLDAAERLRARAVVLPTPASLTPGSHSRERIKAFAEALPRPAGRHYVWAPQGLWEEEESAQLAERLGLVRAFDPLFEQRPPGSVVYARLQTLGAQTGFSEATLDDVLERIGDEPFETAFVSIESDRSFKQAERLIALMSERDSDP